MPKYNPTAEDEELYSPVKPPAKAKPDAAPETPPKEGETDSQTTDEETASTENTALVPNKVLMAPGGEMPKEGDEIVLQVVKVYGDEAEVRYAPAKKTSPDEGPMSGAEGEIDAMDEKGM